MPPDFERDLRAAAAALPLHFVEERLGRFTGAIPRQYRPLIAAARVAADAARAALADSVTAARRAGLSWSEIGGLLGISKQAAQQRFGRSEPAPGPFGTILVAPEAGAGDELSALEAEGRAGRELMRVDATGLSFRQTQQRWEHRRSVTDDPDPAEPDWTLAAEWFVFRYYKRPLA